MTTPEIAQQILDGKWRHAPAARKACQRGAWAELVREIAPAKPLLAGRLDHGRCLALAERSLTGPELVNLSLVPLWACSTEDDVSVDWVAVHGVLREGERLSVREAGPFIDFDDASPRADALWECTVRRWTAATMVESRSYASSVPLELRAGAFAVLKLHVDEVLSVVARPGEPLARPTREVPMFATWFEPRVTVSPELASQIDAMSFTASEEGE